MDVRCASCNEYFPSSSMVQEGDRYYCKNCHTRIKDRQCVPITTNMEVRCTRCDRVIDTDEVRVKDGNVINCLQCYVKSQTPSREESAPKKKPNKEQKCTVCGKSLTIYDDKVQDDGKQYCKTCFDNIRDVTVQEKLNKSSFVPRFSVTSIREDVIGCDHCGGYFNLGGLKESKDGKRYCPKCGKEIKPKTHTTDSLNEEDYSSIAQLFKCIGDPCRVKIIDLLSRRELCVFEFVDMTGFQYSAISYHLKMLKDMGMVKTYERGNFVVYSLTEKGGTVHEFIEKSMDL